MLTTRGDPDNSAGFGGRRWGTYLRRKELTNYYIQLGQSMSDPSTMVQTLVILLVLVNIYILFKIPTMTHSLFTGGTGGHGGGMAMAMMAIRAAI